VRARKWKARLRPAMKPSQKEFGVVATSEPPVLNRPWAAVTLLRSLGQSNPTSDFGKIMGGFAAGPDGTGRSVEMIDCSRLLIPTLPILAEFFGHIRPQLRGDERERLDRRTNTLRSFPRTRESRTRNSNIEQVALGPRFRGDERENVHQPHLRSFPRTRESSSDSRSVTSLPWTPA
jgi:hypothetical protein